MSQKKVQLLNPLSGNINVSGVITASSFVGSGEGLTGVASTDNIQTATEATFLSGVKITGVTTASGGVVGNLTGNVTGNATGLSGTPNITVGSVAASSGTFSGNVSIGGTLTYQDVTNIDSVGIITAQKGIQVLTNGLDVTGFSTFKTGVVVTGVATATSFSGNVTGNLTGDVNAPTFDTGVGGVVVTGVVTATSFSGSGANLTGVSPSTTGIASGSLANGQPVIITTDGKVMGVVGTGSTQVVSGAVQFESGFTHFIDSCYDTTNNKVVICYSDAGNSYYGTAVVGTISGTTVTFGTPVVFVSKNVTEVSCAYDSNANYVVAAFRNNTDSGSPGQGVQFQVSGTSITNIGSPVTFHSASAMYTATAFDSSNNKIVVAYTDSDSGTNGEAVVGTPSGSGLTFGSSTVFESEQVTFKDITFDSTANKVVIAYNSQNGADRGHAIVGTVSGTSISFGSRTTFHSANTHEIACVYDSTNDKTVIVYQDTGGANFGEAIVGTVGGTSIIFGDIVTFYDAEFNFPGIDFDSNRGKVIVAFEADGDASDPGALIEGTVVGTAISFTSKVIYNNAETRYNTVVFDPDTNNTLIGYKDGGSSDIGEARVFRPNSTASNMTTENFIGFSNAAYSNGQTATIQTMGAIDDAQSGLATGRKHYVSRTGIVTLTEDTPSVVAGTAISDTEIIVKG